VSRSLRLPLLLPAAACIALIGAAPASAAGCHLSTSEQRGLGATYTTSLSVKGVSCAKGKRVARAFQACRKSNGGADGRCDHRVRRFSCSERRSNRIRTQYDSSVTCRRGARRVHLTYTMFT
jgi:hypothetical protein